ncbi:MAG: prepilin-type N-terminal cleavage/methylation domain-containing protein [Verrucomicrobiae bacterium]|nr:prepilin-type N-terminal cleavage/methylation domain-containing protein [Verrucomicrobiae bacterium]
MSIRTRRLTNCDQIRGFSLTELLVAVGVSSLVLLMGFTVTQQTLDGWKNAGATLGRSAEARIAFDAVVRDFQSILFRQRDVEWFRLTFDQAIGGESGYSTPQAARLTFFAPRPVSYRLGYEDPIDPEGKFKSFGLYRTYDPSPPPSAQPGAIYESAASTRAFWRSVESETVDPLNLAASNVISFDISLWYRIHGKLRRLPDGVSLRVVGSKVETSPQVSDLRHASQLETVDVRMVSLSKEGALNLEQGIGDTDTILAKHAYRFSARVALNTAGAGLP